MAWKIKPEAPIPCGLVHLTLARVYSLRTVTDAKTGFQKKDIGIIITFKRAVLQTSFNEQGRPVKVPHAVKRERRNNFRQEKREVSQDVAPKHWHRLPTLLHLRLERQTSSHRRLNKASSPPRFSGIPTQPPPWHTVTLPQHTVMLPQHMLLSAAVVAPPCTLCLLAAEALSDRHVTTVPSAFVTAVDAAALLPGGMQAQVTYAHPLVWRCHLPKLLPPPLPPCTQGSDV